MKKCLILRIIVAVLFVAALFLANDSHAFWLWMPKEKGIINPKFAVKDTPQEQFDWAMRFYRQGDFKRAAEEFSRLTRYYPDSDLAPEAQYYAGRADEEEAKYYFAFQNYQKTLDNYPYTKRMEEIIQREYNIANIFRIMQSPKLMELELSLSLERAVIIYQKVVDNSPFGEYADNSLFEMADCYRRMYKYDEAIDTYEKLVNDYPDSKLVPEAKYQMAYTKYEASLNPEYTQESTEAAMEAFDRISQTTAVPAVAKEAEKVLDALKNKKAASEVKIAEFYEKQGKYKSALVYYEEIVGKFPETDSAKLAEERIKRIKKRIKE